MGAATTWAALPERATVTVDRAEFSTFPARLGDRTRVGPAQRLDPDVEATLSADDYYLADFALPGSSRSVDVFMAWYDGQSRHGIHPPEICLPASGREIAWLERSNLATQMETETPFSINRAIIQKGEQRTLVYYWFRRAAASLGISPRSSGLSSTGPQAVARMGPSFG